MSEIEFSYRGKLPKVPTVEGEKVLREASLYVLLLDGTSARVIATQINGEVGYIVEREETVDQENLDLQKRKLNIKGVWCAREDGREELVPAHWVSCFEMQHSPEIREPLLRTALDDGPARSEPLFAKWAGVYIKTPEN